MRRAYFALVLAVAAVAPAAAPCASYVYKADWNVHDPIASTRCKGRYLSLAPAELACTAIPECAAVLGIRASRNCFEVAKDNVYWAPDKICGRPNRYHRCEAVCVDNGMPCRCEGTGVCQSGSGSIPKYELRKGAQATWVTFGSYLKQPAACPWGVSFLLAFVGGVGLYAGGGVVLGRRQGQRVGISRITALHYRSYNYPLYTMIR
jgi:hypothetical protein